MAQCSNCHIELGCSCNLINGLCVSCYANSQNKINKPEIIQSPIQNKQEQIKKNIKISYNPENYIVDRVTPTHDLTINEVLNQSVGLTLEEKLKRINDIIKQNKQ